jgi:hypothetical protein
VVRSVRTREYVHADLEGESRVEEREVLGETVERVTCRWCQGEDTVEMVARPGATSPSGARGGVERKGSP